MPYACTLVGSKWHLTKHGSENSLGTHPSKKACIQQMRAIYANELKRPQNIVYNGFTPYDLSTRIAEAENEIHVVINSRGGDFFDAITMHNDLRNSGKKVIVHVDPFAFSAGAVIALAGDKIYMPENGLMMFHTPKSGSPEGKDAGELEKLAEVLRKSEDILVNTLMSKTKKSDAECRAMMENDTWLTAEEAMRVGIVDEIIPILRDVEVENFFPERIVNFIKEKRDMPLKEVCQQFGITDGDETKLVEYIEGLKKNQPKPPSEIAPAILNMIKKARETELNMLVSDGKALPTVINELKITYLTDDRVKLDAQSDNHEFDQIVNALSKNEPIISFGGKTGMQKIPNPGKDSGIPGDDADLLVKDMQKRK